MCVRSWLWSMCQKRKNGRYPLITSGYIPSKLKETGLQSVVNLGLFPPHGPGVGLLACGYPITIILARTEQDWRDAQTDVMCRLLGCRVN